VGDREQKHARRETQRVRPGTIRGSFLIPQRRTDRRPGFGEPTGQRPQSFCTQGCPDTDAELFVAETDLKTSRQPGDISALDRKMREELDASPPSATICFDRRAAKVPALLSLRFFRRKLEMSAPLRDLIFERANFKV
jgi:hypothetical protein